MRSVRLALFYGSSQSNTRRANGVLARVAMALFGKRLLGSFRGSMGGAQVQRFIQAGGDRAHLDGSEIRHARGGGESGHLMSAGGDEVHAPDTVADRSTVAVDELDGNVNRIDG